MTEAVPDAGAFWGYLFQENKRPTDKLDRLLKGLAACISTDLYPYDSVDLKPSQLAAFYRSVGGQYDPLFLDMPSQSIAYIYKSLGCLHSLQPDPQAKEGIYASPCIPALKPTGFVTWQTIQLLLGPEEHVPFIQNALKRFNVRDPSNGQLFPKELPREAFPLEPDAKMVEWHEGVSSRLKTEAQKESELSKSLGDNKPSTERRPSASNATASNNVLALKHDSEDRHHAASYFSNPFNKNRDGQSGVVRSFKKAPQKVFEGGKAVAGTAGRTIRNIVDTNLWNGDADRGSRERERDRRRRSTTADDSEYSSSISPEPGRSDPRRRNTTHLHPRSHSPIRAQRGDRTSRSTRVERRPQPAPRAYSAKATPHEGRPPQRRRSDTRGSSAEELPRRPYVDISPRATHPNIRRHRSQEPPSSPRDYFDNWQQARPHNYSYSPTEVPQHRPTSHHTSPRTMSGGMPEIRRTRPTSRGYSGTDSVSSDSDHSNPGQRNVHFAPNSNFTASTSPAMAAKVGHQRVPSGGSLGPADMRYNRPSPSEYTPIDQRTGSTRLGPSNTFPREQTRDISPRPHARFAPDPAPSHHNVRRGSEPSISPVTETDDANNSNRAAREEGRRRYTATTGPSSTLYGEVAPNVPLSNGRSSTYPMRPQHSGGARKPHSPVEGVKGRRYANEVSWPGAQD